MLSVVVVVGGGGGGGVCVCAYVCVCVCVLTGWRLSGQVGGQTGKLFGWMVLERR